jgi:peptidoglycan/xylan/chitin deacetylase (PgdA/CDA1 family)
LRVPFAGRDVLVLCYHAVSEHWPARLSITPELLEEHVHLLLERGYVGATFSQAITEPPARRTLAVTFDDAFKSVLELAFPILSRAGVPGTVFVPTRQIGGGPMAWPGIDEWVGGPYERELTGMSWEEIGSLAQSGWEIGSHSRSHPRLTELDDDALAEELSGSRADCAQRLGACDSLAYPYGSVDRRVVAAAGAAGYSTAAGLPRRHEPPNPLCWPRSGIYFYDDLRKFRRKVSPAMRRARSSRLWPLANVARAKVRAR